jgi:hypothetical protein
MEPTQFDLTPEQKDLLEVLSRTTGKAIPTLIAEALAGLQAQVPPGHGNGEAHGSDAQEPPQPPYPRKPIWELFEDASREIPDEDLDRLPTDLAAQVDHYLYGTPKR